MLVLAALPDRLAHRLRQGAAHRFGFEVVRTWPDALAAILRRPVELAVFDPALEGPPRGQEIERLRVLFPSLPSLVYTHLTAAVAPVLLQLGRSGIRQVLVAGHDDHPRRVSDVLVAEASHAVAAKMIEGFGALLADCPDGLRWAIETMVRDPASFQSVQQLADRARMDRRTCVRWFARAKLPPPKVMLTVIRATYAHRLLQDPGYTVDDVAAKLGYSQTRTLSLAAKEVFGITPGELRVRLSPEEAMEIVRERYFRPAKAVREAS
jgi:AraC-like DNA-binding protein